MRIMILIIARLPIAELERGLAIDIFKVGMG